jgi:ActR/RegA family two-component response regulator
MKSLRMLFVDDELSIRLTLPEILRERGYQVAVASTVSEALASIQSRPFDVLLSDLNIGSPGDGFTVVSAMRRTQPACVTLILTGYPGFETALQAIRNQVDDYLVKPTQIEQLVKTIEEKLRNRTSHEPPPVKRVSEILWDSQTTIANRTVNELRNQHRGAKGNVREGMSELLSALIVGLNPGSELQSYLQGAAYGAMRHAQKCSIDDLFDEFRAMERILYEVTQENLLAVDVSNLVPDLRILNDHMQDVLRHAVHSYLGQTAAA